MFSKELEDKKRDFKMLAEKKRLAHAYLFYGEEKNGKEEKFVFALSLANFLENGIFKEPAQPLREVLVVSPDSDKQTIGIDSVRFLKYFLWQKPANSDKRIVIVKGAENLTPEAQNAALKIVEEPPEAALIIFIGSAGENLFPALVSRFQKIYFSGGGENVRVTESRRESVEDIDDIIENNRIDEFFKSLIDGLRKNPIKNSGQLKQALNRLVLMKEFNVNKRLQLRALISSMAK